MTQSGGVERAASHSVNAQVGKPRPHFTGRFCRERECEHFVRGIDPGLYAIGDSVSDGARFARTRTSKHDHRTDERERDFALVFVEGFDECAHRVSSRVAEPKSLSHRLALLYGVNPSHANGVCRNCRPRCGDYGLP